MANPLRLSLTVSGHELFCDRFEGEFALSRAFVLRVRALVNIETLGDYLTAGAACTVALEGGGTETTLTGIVQSFSVGPKHSHHAVEIVVVPAFAALQIARTHRVLADVTLAEIVATVDTEALLSLVDPPATKLSHAAQHDESDWAFLERLFAREGLAYWYDSDKDKITVGKTALAAAAPPGGDLPCWPAGPDVPLLEGVRVRETAVPLGLLARGKPQTRAHVEVKGKTGESAAGLSRWPARAEDDAGAKAVAITDYESRLAYQRLLSGQIQRVDVLPGRKLTVTDHPAPGVDGEWICTAARLSLQIRSPLDGKSSRLAASFEAVPVETPVAAPFRADAVLGAGVEPAEVIGPKGAEIHVEKTGAVRVRPRWDRVSIEAATARPARVLHDLLEEAWAIPRVSAEVLTASCDDDHDRPLVLGYLHDPQHPTAVALPAQKSVTAFRTPTSKDDGTFSEFRVDDAKDAGLLAFRAAGNFEVDVGHERGIRIRGSHAVTVKKSRTDLVKGDEEERITTDASETISGASTEAIEGGQTITVLGKITSHVAKTFSGTISGARTVDVQGARSLTVTGDAKSDVTQDRQRTVLGKHQASADGKWIVSVTGGWDRTFNAALSTSITAKRDVEAKELSVQVKGTYSETRGLTLTKTSGKLGYSAQGALTAKATGPLTVSAEAFKIVVASEATLKVGGSTIKITSSGVEIKGALVTIPAAMATLRGATVKHNQ